MSEFIHPSDYSLFTSDTMSCLANKGADIAVLHLILTKYFIGYTTLRVKLNIQERVLIERYAEFLI